MLVIKVEGCCWSKSKALGYVFLWLEQSGTAKRSFTGWEIILDFVGPRSGLKPNKWWLQLLVKAFSMHYCFVAHWSSKQKLDKRYLRDSSKLWCGKLWKSKLYTWRRGERESNSTCQHPKSTPVGVSTTRSSSISKGQLSFATLFTATASASTCTLKTERWYMHLHTLPLSMLSSSPKTLTLVECILTSEELLASYVS